MELEDHVYSFENEDSEEKHESIDKDSDEIIFQESIKPSKKKQIKKLPRPNKKGGLRTKNKV